MNIIQLFKPKNLALLAFAMFIFRYGFLDQQPGLLLALNHWQYALLVLSAVLIAAGGSLMETVASPGKNGAAISEAKGYNVYGVLNIIAIGIGYYLADAIGKSSFVAVFVIAASMLYFAANNFRQVMLVGNIFTAVCVWASVIVIGIFNFYPFLAVLDIKDYYITMFDLLRDYALFASFLTLLYTIMKDMQSMDTDYNNNKTTLPIAIGRNRAAKAVFVLTIISLVMLLYYINTYIIGLMYALVFALVFMAGPLIFAVIKLWSAKTANDFSLIATAIKLVMAFTALSIMVVTYNVNHHA
ncbi:MAG: prenyltransferase [Flavobacterium sp.]